MTRRDDLSTPRQPRRLSLHYDRDAFGDFSESIARFFGTARFLVIQTVIVIVWISVNVVWGLDVGNIRSGSFDPYPFILLNLAFSTQAAYAAPLILLAQSRQERRDRVQTDIDRRVAERTQMDTEFLAREIAGVRLALADVPTAGDLGDQLERLTKAVQQLSERLDAIERPVV